MRRWKSRSDSFQPWRAAGSAGRRPSIAASRRSHSRVRPAALGGEPRDRGLEQRAPPAGRSGWRRAEAGRGGQALRRVAATNEPEPGRVSITPWTCSAAIASRTEARPTSSRRASSRSDGSRSPGAKAPGADLGREPLRHVLVALQRPNRLERRTRLDDNWFAHRTSKVHAMATTFNSVDPSHGRDRPAYEEAPTDDVHAAVAAAADAHRSGALADRGQARRPAARRRGRLRAAGDEIVATAMAETGLPEVRLRGELERIAGQLEAFAAVVDAGDYVEAIIDTPDPDAKPIPRPTTCAACSSRSGPSPSSAPPTSRSRSRPPAATRRATRRRRARHRQGPPTHPGTSELVARELSAAVADAALPLGHVRASPRRTLLEVARSWSTHRASGQGLHRLLRVRARDPDRAAARSRADPRLRRDGLREPDRTSPRRLSSPSAPARSRRGCRPPWRTSAASSAPTGLVFVPYGEPGDAFADDAPSGQGTRSGVLLNERTARALRERQQADRELVDALDSGPGELRARRHEHDVDAELAGRGRRTDRRSSTCRPCRFEGIDVARHLAARRNARGPATATLHAQPGEDVAAIAARGGDLP